MTPATRLLVNPAALLPACLEVYRGQIGQFVRFGGGGSGLTLYVLAFEDGTEQAFTPGEVLEVEEVRNAIDIR